MKPLFDRVRPATLDDVVGQPKAVAAARASLAQGVGGRAFWISGPSGTGKTTIARILASSIADPIAIEEYDSADDFGAEAVRALSASMQLYGLGRGGRAWIINEAHSLRGVVVRMLLGVLERLTPHCTVIFTTTSEGETDLFARELDASPLLSRCTRIRTTGQGFCGPAAAFAQRAAQSAGLDGQSIEAYEKLLKRCGNNLRAALCEIESGAMLETGR